MDALEKLAKLFEKFPGIGPRQAGRFVQFLLKSPAGYRTELIAEIQKLSRAVSQCTACFRFFEGAKGRCGACSNIKDPTQLMVVAHDVDADAMARTGYEGAFFVLGGTVILGSEMQHHLRERDLLARITKDATHLAEIILAFPANPEGDATAARVRANLQDEGVHTTIHALGRGLSTGSELEYADPETLRFALKNRA